MTSLPSLPQTLLGNERLVNRVQTTMSIPRQEDPLPVGLSHSGLHDFFPPIAPPLGSLSLFRSLGLRPPVLVWRPKF